MPVHPIIAEMWRQKCATQEYQRAYCTTTAPLTLTEYFCPVRGATPRVQQVVLPPGTTLKIVMVSQLGDIGLTDDVTVTYRYKIRLLPEDPRLTAFRWEP